MSIDTHLLNDAISHFDHLEKNIASHSNVLDSSIYPQPTTYLTTHSTGFGWEWLAPRSAEECYGMIKDSIDSHKPVKSTFYDMRTYYLRGIKMVAISKKENYTC